jgi:predicted component of type VI protein secretion system
LIILPPPTEEDYREGAKAFGLDRMAKDLGVSIDYTEATEGGLGARWLEEKLGDLLRLAKRTGKSLFPAAETPPPEPTDFDVEDDPSYEEPF